MVSIIANPANEVNLRHISCVYLRQVISRLWNKVNRKAQPQVKKQLLELF